MTLYQIVATQINQFADAFSLSKQSIILVTEICTAVASSVGQGLIGAVYLVCQIWNLLTKQS